MKGDFDPEQNKDPEAIKWVQGSQHGYVPPEYEGRDFVIASP